MNSLMLCEGKTDAILLSYYMKNVFGWEPLRKAPSFLNIQVERNRNQNVAWYKHGEDLLLIAAVGGNSNFGHFFEQRIKAPLIDAGAFQKIAIVTDRDKRKIQEIEKSFIEDFGGFFTTLKNQVWLQQDFQNGFKQDEVVDVLLLVIPEAHQGALETLLLDSISEDPYDAAIVDAAKKFVHNTRCIAKRYISSDRLELKSQLSTTWAIQSPEKVFDFINEQIDSVEWDKSQTLRECFKELAKL